MVEFTLAALLLFLVLFGIAEMGWLFSRYLCVTQVARQGCRALALAESVAAIPTDMATAAADMGLGPKGWTGKDPNISMHDVDPAFDLTWSLQFRRHVGTNWEEWNPATDASPPSGPDRGDQVKVTVTYHYPALVGGFILESKSATVSASTVMRREQKYEP